MAEDEPVPFPHRIGRVARAHGLRGEVLVQMFRRRALGADPARMKFRKLTRPLEVEVEYPDERLERLHVSHVRWVDPIRVVLRITELQDRDEAEALAGCYLDIDPEQPSPALLDDIDGAFGARALDADDGRVLGEIFAIRDNGAQALFELTLDADPEQSALVPVVEDFVAEIGRDDAGRFVRLRLIDGLLEVTG